MRATRCFGVIVAVVCFAGLAGCSKTNLTNLWKAPDAAAPLTNVLVVTLERDADMNRLWEDAIVAELQAAGVQARPSYALFPAQFPDSQQIAVVAKRDGYDGVIVTRQLAVTHRGVEGGYAESGPAGRDNYWKSWYHTAYLAASQNQPPDDEPARFQIDAVATRGQGDLVWTGTTTPIDPHDVDKVREEVCGQLVSELTRQGIIARRK